jgi:hypothetical protein
MSGDIHSGSLNVIRGAVMQKLSFQNIVMLFAIPALVICGAAGCKDMGVQSPDTSENVRLSIRAAGSVLEKPAHEVLHITSVKILLKKITFKQSTSDDSADVYSGPSVVELDFSTQLHDVVVTRVRPGSYDRVRFTIHKPEDQEQLLDSVFADDAGGSALYSVVVTGAYHETPFVYKFRESATQEISFLNPLTVPESGTVNVTLRIDPYVWFTDGLLIFDPFNQRNEIDDRLRQSIAEAYRDNDRNGEPD